VILQRRSLTVRLTLLFAIVSTAVLVLMGYAFYVSLGAHFLHEDAIELRGKVELVRNLFGHVKPDDDLETLRARLDDALVGHHNLHLSIQRADGTVLLAVPSAPSPVDRPGRRDLAVHASEGLMIGSASVADVEYRVTSFEVTDPFANGRSLRATLAMNVDHHQMFMDRVLGTVLLSVILGALVAGLLGWGAARIGIAPLRAFASVASRISAEHLNDRISVQTVPPELAGLAQSFNAMLARLESSFRRLKDFSSDLAHELRTPVSALMTQAQVALSRSRSAEEYREVIYSAVEEYDRLARMTTDMLFLAKADAGLVVPQSEAFDVRPEVDALFEFYDALAESRQLKLVATGNGTVHGDRSMLRRAVSNLLSNAIRHSAAGDTVDVSIGTEDGTTTIAVCNRGTPIAAEHLPRLFDRFYMVDAARDRGAEGAGLGLAITKSVIEAQSGTIAVASDSYVTRFEIRLPAGRVTARL
jgi:two-component system, OmpR family, heavy metal sensor histidine kinase CusS